MSRIAKTPIEVPAGVEVKIVANTLSAKGPKGEMSHDLLPGIGLLQEDGVLKVRILEHDGTPGKTAPNKTTPNKTTPNKRTVAMSGTARAMVHNLIRGVSEGFEKRLSIVGVGYRAQAQGRRLNLSLGFSHPVAYQLPPGVTVETPSQTEIVVRGMDKQQVGQVAAEIRGFRPPEPYKGKGIRYQDEHVRRKQAKKK